MVTAALLARRHVCWCGSRLPTENHSSRCPACRGCWGRAAPFAGTAPALGPGVAPALPGLRCHPHVGPSLVSFPPCPLSPSLHCCVTGKSPVAGVSICFTCGTPSIWNIFWLPSAKCMDLRDGKMNSRLSVSSLPSRGSVVIQCFKKPLLLY